MFARLVLCGNLSDAAQPLDLLLHSARRRRLAYTWPGLAPRTATLRFDSRVAINDPEQLHASVNTDLAVDPAPSAQAHVRGVMQVQDECR